MQIKSRDLVGERSKTLTVQEFAGRRNRNRLWRCRCNDCLSDGIIRTTSQITSGAATCDCKLASDKKVRKIDMYADERDPFWFEWATKPLRADSIGPETYRAGKQEDPVYIGN